MNFIQKYIARRKAERIKQQDRELQRKLNENAMMVAFRMHRSSNRFLCLHIFNYYRIRSLRWPTFDEARRWANTESGEVDEAILSQVSGWIRNNPEQHLKKYSQRWVMEEMADQIFMLLVAGMVEGYDLLDLIDQKLQRKLDEMSAKNNA